MEFRYEQLPGTVCGYVKPPPLRRSMPLWHRATVLLGGVVFLPVLLGVLGLCVLFARGMSSTKHKFTEAKT